MVTAHKMAIESEHITADMVESTEFPHLAIKYNVRGVPRIVVNEETHIEGALPEQAFVDEVMKAVQKRAPNSE